MASGLAVAGFDYAAGRQFVCHDKNGLLAPCDRPDQLIKEANRLATDGVLRERLRRAARSGFEQQSWSSVIERFERDLLIAAHSDGPNASRQLRAVST